MIVQNVYPPPELNNNIKMEAGLGFRVVGRGGVKGFLVQVLGIQYSVPSCCG